MIPKDKTLLPYQIEATHTSLTWLKNSPSRAVYNGSDPGTGKSIMTVATLNALGFSKILIICPAIMRPTWQNEYREWTTQPHLRVNIIESSKCINKLSNPPQVLIISYDLAAKLPIANWLVQQKFQVLVCDEAHMLGSLKAQRTKSILKVIWPSIPYRIPLSGTPFESNIISTYPVFSRCMPGHFGTKAEFGARFSNPILTPWGIQYKGVRNYEELKNVIKKNFFIRYKLEDVIKELPEISYKNIYLDKKYSHKEYERAIKEAVEAGTITGDERIIPTHIMSLRKFQGELKIKPIAEFAELLLEQEIPIVIFPYHTCVIEGLKELLKKYKPVVIDGSTSPKNKQLAVESFQGGKTNCFIGQIQSAGVGITLTRSSTVLLPEMPFEGATIKQAVARVRRIGQKNAMVVHNFICQNSYDEKILKIVKDKADAFDKVFN